MRSCRVVQKCPHIQWFFSSRRRFALRVTLRVCLFAHLLIVSLFLAGDAAGQGAPETLVPIAPCRILDTRETAADDAIADVVRQIDIAASRCGRFVPNVATAYALRVTNFSRTFPVGLPIPAPVIESPARRATAAMHSFPVPPGAHIAVDVEGYYVPPGTAVDPRQQSSATESAITTDPETSPSKTNARSGRPEVLPATNVYQGTKGSLDLDGSIYPVTGVFGRSTLPWVMFDTGESGGTGGFGVYNSNFSELMRVSSHGPTRLVMGWSYLSGRTDYRETPNVPGNVVHNVKIVNPRDGSGGAATPVTFFQAKTDDEVGSPPTTKFLGSTLGYYDTEHTNFDSQIYYHFPFHSNHYHYRAYSSREAKPTFWVRAASNYDALSGHRADMYVSGRVGIGTTTASAALHVEDLTNNVGMTLSAGDNPGVLNSPTLTLMRKDGNDAQLAKYGLRLDAGDGNKFKLLYGGAGDFGLAPLLTVDTNGTLTAKVIGAVYQDVAEWVPATVDMTPGTVVVLNTEKTNEVMPSALEYDGRVAGVISAQPGLLLGVEGESKEMVATTGRVKVKVDATRTPIQIGDLLVSSSKPGTAMKSVPIDVGGVAIHRPGTIIGKALEPLASGEGKILVLLSLQ